MRWVRRPRCTVEEVSSTLVSNSRGDWPVAERPMLVSARFLDRLRERWSVPVTILSAPAGCGKTTLLTQAVAANRDDPTFTCHRMDRVRSGSASASVISPIPST